MNDDIDKRVRGCAEVAPPAATETFRHADGYAAFTRWWLPPRPCGAVLYLHGIQSHGGWYEGSGAYLARAGFTVLMPDRRGSGRNQAARGHADDPRRWLDDVDELLLELCRRAGTAAAHVVGVSWGGKLAAAAAVAGVVRIASLTLIAPGIFPRLDLPLGDKMKIAWSLVTEPRRLFPIPLNDARLFTANPDRITYVEQDSLALRELTGAFLMASRRLDHVARRLPKSEWGGPVHLLLAEHDRIIDNERTRAWFERLPTERRRMVEYNGAHHTLEFEPNPQPMRADVCRWLTSGQNS